MANFTTTGSDTFPTGMVINTYTDIASLAVTHRSNNTTYYLADPELSFPSGLSTDDKIFVEGSVGACSSDGHAGAQVSVGFAYSTDNWSTPVQFGPTALCQGTLLWIETTVQFRSGVSFATLADVPTASAFKIRIKLFTWLTPYAPINGSEIQYLHAQLIKG